MGTFKFSCKMLKREKKQAISYGITILFTVFVSFVVSSGVGVIATHPITQRTMIPKSFFLFFKNLMKSTSKIFLDFVYLVIIQK